MDIGLGFVGFGDAAQPEIATEIATSADELGFSTLWAAEHSAMVWDYKTDYPYGRESGFPVDVSEDFLDPIAVLSFCASLTKRLRLGTSVSLLPNHNPIVFAKLIASMDYLSKGRFTFGVGLGWMVEEFEALQRPGKEFPVSKRALLAREGVEAMRALWTERESSYSGETVAFEKLAAFPKPHQSHIPILYGGNTDAAIRRAVRYCDGLYIFNLTPDEAAERVNTARARHEEAEEKSDSFKVVVGALFDATPDLRAEYEAAGVDELIIQLQPLLFAHSEGGKGKLKAAEVRPIVEGIARDWIH